MSAVRELRPPARAGTIEAPTPPPPAYTGFDGQYIGGTWRPGRSGEKLKDADPYSGETLTEIALADASDLSR